MEKGKITSQNQPQKPTNPNITSLLKQPVGETISQTSQAKEGAHIKMGSPQVATFTKALTIVILNSQTKHG